MRIKGEKQTGQKRNRTVVSILFVLATVFVLRTVVAYALPVFAQGDVNTPAQLTNSLGANEQFRQATGLSGTDIRVIIAKIIRAVLGLVGLIMISFIVYAGYLWMTSEGEEEKIMTAKNMLKNLVIGLAIILMSVAIVQFVIQKLVGEGGGGLGGAEGVSGGQVFFEGHAQLGTIIESHYPARNAQDIPRNTMIAVTFKDKIKQETIINGMDPQKFSGALNDVNIKIYRVFKADGKTLGVEAGALKGDQVSAGMSADHKTFVFKPSEYLGDPNKNVEYKVVLGKGIKIDDGTKGGKDSQGLPYDWNFTVSPKVDLTPPKVVSVLPYPMKEAKDKQPRNVILQINFSEPVDPLSASGKPEKDVFENLTVTDAAGNVVSGEFRISNGYRTVEFVPSEQCGENSCGMPVYCLPAQAALTAQAKAADLAAPSLPTAKLPANGVIDMAVNSLDGGGSFAYDAVKKDFVFPQGNGKAEGSPADNFIWKFNTSNQKDVTPPTLTSITPSVGAQDIAADAPLDVMFSKVMSSYTFENVTIKASKADKYIWFTKNVANYDAQGVDLSALAPDGTPVSTEPANHTKLIVAHGKFWRDPPPPAPLLNVVYYPFIPSTVTDAYQNCFYPAIGPQCTGDNTDPSCFNGEKKAYSSAQNCEKDNGKGQIIYDKDAPGCSELKIEYPPTF
ncbi:MAG TPA: hypothetical protein DEF59_00640 [Candidatus Magasanikbacteria bacterium]|nr:hypothetical protein [Candidatus Magasanikbacteria bacterium]